MSNYLAQYDWELLHVGARQPGPQELLWVLPMQQRCCGDPLSCLRVLARLSAHEPEWELRFAKLFHMKSWKLLRFPNFIQISASISVFKNGKKQKDFHIVIIQKFCSLSTAWATLGWSFSVKIETKTFPSFRHFTINKRITKLAPCFLQYSGAIICRQHLKLWNIAHPKKYDTVLCIASETKYSSSDWISLVFYKGILYLNIRTQSISKFIEASIRNLLACSSGCPRYYLLEWHWSRHISSIHLSSQESTVGNV